MSLLDQIEGWVSSNSKQFVVARMPESEPAVPLVPDQSYFALWLTHGFLARDASWFRRRYPAVHVSARLDIAGATTAVTKLAQPTEGMLGPGVWTNYAITGTTPYRGGSLELEAGLKALERSAQLKAALDVIASFSALVAPPLSMAVATAAKVGGGIEKVLASAREEIELGIHETLTAPGAGGEHELAPGHLAVVRATSSEVDPERLSVREQRLHVSGAEGTRPLEGFSYMLFGVEARRERDDWRFESFDELIRKAIDAHFAGDGPRFEAFRNCVLAEILKSPDLTSLDRFRVARAVAAELLQVKEMGYGAVAEAPSTLADIAKRAAAVDDPVATSEISLQELLA